MLLVPISIGSALVPVNSSTAPQLKWHFQTAWGARSRSLAARAGGFGHMSRDGTLQR